MKLPEPIGWSYLFEDDGSLCQQFDTREEADRWVDSPDCLWSGYVSPLYSEAQVKELLARAEAFEEAAKAVLDAGFKSNGVPAYEFIAKRIEGLRK